MAPFPRFAIITAAVVVAASGAACTFNGDLPPTSELVCDVDIDCLSGSVCASNIRRCVALEDRDTTPPDVVDETIVSTPATLRIDQRFEAHFEVTEA